MCRCLGLQNSTGLSFAEKLLDNSASPFSDLRPLLRVFPKLIRDHSGCLELLLKQQDEVHNRDQVHNSALDPDLPSGFLLLGFL